MMARSSCQWSVAGRETGLPTTNNQQPTTNNQQPTTDNPQFTKGIREGNDVVPNFPRFLDLV
jgi:hypothetical protein